MKQPFIAIHDYQHGGAIVRVFANTACEVAEVLRAPTWRVCPESDPSCPDVTGVRLLESDIDNRAQWLQNMIYTQDRTAEGKHAFPVRGTKFGRSEYRWIWARSREEVASRFPDLRLLNGVPLEEHELRAMGNSDIDVPDEFTSRYVGDA